LTTLPPSRHTSLVRATSGPGALAAACVLVAAAAWAVPYAVGDQVRPFALDDQHGRRVEVGAAVRALVVTRDMGGGDVVKEALADADQGFLDARHAVYVADISRMPALISRMIALPRMRKRRYRVLVDADGAVAREFPAVEGKPTVVALDRLRVTAVTHPATAAELRAALGE
jgi:hypothetical protein